MLTVISVLKNQELFAQEQARKSGEEAPAAYHGLFSSHPENDRRLQEVITAAKQYQGAEVKHPNPEDYLKLLDGMVFGDSESQGIVRHNHFYHRDLDLYLGFPDNWQLINQPKKLLGVSSDKSQLIQFVLGDAGGLSPQAFLSKTFPSLKNGRALGRNAYSGRVLLDSPWGKKNGRVAAVEYNGSTFVVLGVGKSQLSGQDFDNTVASIRGLSKQEQKLATGRKLRLIRVQRGDTFADWAERSNIDQFEVSQLRLLNGLYPEGEPESGQLIKLVQ